MRNRRSCSWEENIYAYNSAKINRADGQLFAHTIRDNSEEIIAGIAGWTWAEACEITRLWISEKWRGKGFGKQLLETAEAEARNKGCLRILVKTYGFQAPAFYESSGFKTEHVLSNFPPGHTYYTFLKELHGDQLG